MTLITKVNTNRMKKFNLLIVLIIGAVVASCSGEEIPATNEAEELVKTVNIETRVVEPERFESHLRVVGMVETSNDIQISAEVSGRILNYKVDEGESVKKGQTILKIDDSKLKQERARLEALTAQAKENYERLQKMYEEESIGSEIEYLNARYNYEQNNSALESITVDLNNTSIKAPFDGTVETILLDEGEMASPGVPVVRLIGDKRFIISAGVPARYADVIANGDEVQLWFDTQSSDTLTGSITYVAKSINQQNRTFRIEVLLPDGQNFYKVDMIANLRLNTLSEEGAIVVSEEYIYKKNDEYIAYVLSENAEGKAVAEQRKVTLGPSFKTNIIVRDGLKTGDKLITTGSAFLNDGMRVNEIEPADKSLAVQ
ncbi:MAG: efflux RND transporter periplasmic adaptor subunit [Balneolaceae bacterium]|nr:efflux RND transporter periplasmic adaptor subunit [Balneolaceae bacterium]